MKKTEAIRGSCKNCARRSISRLTKQMHCLGASEVKDVHDCDANIEISYLPQKSEEYEQVVILTTNYCGNKRRFIVLILKENVEAVENASKTVR